MTNIDLRKAEIYLLEMADLLSRNGASLHWAERLRSLSMKKTMHPDDFRSQIRGLFGGMGSLNDIVICNADGRMDQEANIEFDELRQKLYKVI